MAQKVFHFSLGALLRVRGIKEKHALGELSKIISIYNQHQNRINSSRKEMHLNMADYAEHSGKAASGFNLSQERMWNSYFGRLENQIEEEQKKIAKLRPELEDKQRGVQKARQERRVMELIQEREKKEFIQKCRKKGKKEIDEANRKRGFFLLGNL